MTLYLRLSQSTYCNSIQQHCQSIGRSVHVINLDPAAEEIAYQLSADVRELISVSNVMEEMKLGPNGALLFCMEYLEYCIDDWLSEVLQGYDDDECVLFDCPGQIELYSNHSAFRNIVESLHAWGWRLVAVYMLDSQFITDGFKFIAGCLQCQSAMMSLELPHVNVLSKVDGFVDKSVLDLFLKPEHMFLAHNLQDPVCGRFSNLTRAVSGLLDDYSMVFFHTLDISDEQSLADLLYTVVGMSACGK